MSTATLPRLPRQGQAGDALKLCSGKYGCAEKRWIAEFRILSNGQVATYCRECEREFDRFRRGWPSRFDPREIPSGLLPPAGWFAT